MDAILETPSISVAIADGFISKGKTTIVMQCHDREFNRVTVLEEDGDKLFTAESRGAPSLTWPRAIKDSSGNPILELRKIPNWTLKNKWVVENSNGREVCSLRQCSFGQPFVIDVVIQHDDYKDDEVKIEVRPKDKNALTTLVNVEGVSIAEIQMTGVNTGRGDLDRSVWKAQIAPGVDHALIVAIMLCRAEIQHVWKK